VLTAANQLTLLRMLLIPAFVILVLYGHLGWALAVFVTAGITDGLDGVIARRSNQRTSLGAWLDPMADKLLLVTTFVVLALPNLDLANRLPVWLTVCIISRDVVIILRQDRHGDLHRHRRRRHAVQLPGVPLGDCRHRRMGVAGDYDHLEPALHLACATDHRRAGEVGRFEGVGIRGSDC
jgi:hypothetical protein